MHRSGIRVTHRLDREALRSANIRDGIEDDENLWRLAQVEGSINKARDAAQIITEDTKTFARDQKGRVDAARRDCEKDCQGPLGAQAMAAVE